MVHPGNCFTLEEFWLKSNFNWERVAIPDSQQDNE